MKERNTHGGPGRGQGRKPLPPGRKRIACTFKLDPDIAAWLRCQPESASRIIEAALIKQHGLEKPE